MAAATASTAFADKMARMLQALDAVDISKEDVTQIGGPRYFYQMDEPADAVVDADVAMDDHEADRTMEDIKGGMEGKAAATTIDSNDSDDDSLEEGPVELYGDKMDEDDAEYVTANLRGEVDAGSDAALACPCCFVTVCYASQRHEKYETQYRAEKAVNCRVKTDRILVYENSKLSTKLEQDGAADEYFAVACSDCDTTVGVKLVGQSSQYIHFFQVIPSHI
ncbi:Aste57867_21222 [Aphanomyces stellatus]|uniref:Aste57867_21222 protein n=1 Tax=Aphanomyces stellatus TaxID=120398 RepID=A0A485LHJ9_9STRA|nr:hypothetical protein As57867_021154 [Aphanomyces stellatus]VFT97894.1 Aste57867_21222 [Aphanomyces stellatus]